MNQTLVLPDWMLSEQQACEVDRLLASEWFLVRIAGNGEVWRCGRCSCKHDYLSYFCVSRPWNGLTRGLYAYWKTVGTHGVASYLPPAEQARISRLSGFFGAMPDLATSHPQMARALSTGERDINLSAQALGVLEPITPEEARRFATLINARANRTVIRLDPRPLPPLTVLPGR